SFTVVSTIVPEVAGCYSDTGSTNENEIYYSETGTTDAQQNIVGAFDLGETGAPDIRWVIGYVVSDTTTTASSNSPFPAAAQAPPQPPPIAPLSQPLPPTSSPMLPVLQTPALLPVLPVNLSP
ncbi:unnamed protein product, partial [Ascophyllum nodosum]